MPTPSPRSPPQTITSLPVQTMVERSSSLVGPLTPLMGVQMSLVSSFGGKSARSGAGTSGAGAGTSGAAPSAAAVSGATLLASAAAASAVPGQSAPVRKQRFVAEQQAYPSVQGQVRFSSGTGWPHAPRRPAAT